MGTTVAADARDSRAEYRGAPREKLEELHALVLKALLDAFEKGELSAALLGVARKFLRDNGVKVDAAGAADLRRSLEELRSLGLPFVNPTKKESKS